MLILAAELLLENSFFSLVFSIAVLFFFVFFPSFFWVFFVRIIDIRPFISSSRLMRIVARSKNKNISPYHNSFNFIGFTHPIYSLREINTWRFFIPLFFFFFSFSFSFFLWLLPFLFSCPFFLFFASPFYFPFIFLCMFPVYFFLLYFLMYIPFYLFTGDHSK